MATIHHPPNATTPATPTTLPRVLGLTDVIGILVGTTIGSGIFIMPAVIAARVESPVLMLAVWVTGGVLSFFGALAFSELAAMYPHAGGMYIYLREAYGRFVAFLFGWALFFVIEAGSIATLAVAFSTKYLPFFVTLPPFGSKMVSVALIAVFATVNYMGARAGAIVQNVFTAVKFTAILGVTIVVFAFARGEAAHFVSPPAPPFSGALVGNFGLALVAALWAYKGWEAVTFTSGEVKRPERNLPVGLFLGTLLVIILYISANLAYLYVFPASVIAGSDRVAADAMQAAVGPIGAGIVAAAILCSIAGATNGTVLTASRVFFAMAQDRLFFPQLARVHPRFLTPAVSIVTTATWAAVLAVSGTFEQLATYVIFGQWLFFGLAVAAVIILRRSRPDHPRPYRTWGYPATPILFVVAALLISLNTIVNQFWNAVVGLSLILLGAPAYYYWTRGQPSSEHR